MNTEPNGAYGPVPRKEDARFIRGRGTFVDDIQLPGMLYGAILRSPLPHARITAIDTVAAAAHPRVAAVFTGQDLAGLGLAWMPTMSQDAQAVLATDKVRFQGQEVAFVVAQDRYSARDALELIHVEYEPLPVVADAKLALGPGAPVIRDDLAGKEDNHIFDWEAGDQAAGQVGRGPVGEPDVHHVRPRLPHARGDRRHRGRPGARPAGHGARRPRRLQRDRPADQVPGRVLPHLHRLLRPAGRALPGDRGLHQQGARRGRLLVLVPHHRGGVPGRADDGHPGPRARHGPGRAADEEPAAARAVP